MKKWSKNIRRLGGMAGQGSTSAVPFEALERRGYFDGRNGRRTVA